MSATPTGAASQNIRASISKMMMGGANGGVQNQENIAVGSSNDFSKRIYQQMQMSK